MSLLDNLSVRAKLTLPALLTSAGTAALAGIGFVAYDLYDVPLSLCTAAVLPASLLLAWMFSIRTRRAVA